MLGRLPWRGCDSRLKKHGCHRFSKRCVLAVGWLALVIPAWGVTTGTSAAHGSEQQGIRSHNSEESLDTVAYQAVDDIRQWLERIQGSVTRVDSRHRMVYVTGFPSGIVDTGARIAFYRTANTGVASPGDRDAPWIEMGDGVVSQSAGSAIGVVVNRIMFRQFRRLPLKVGTSPKNMRIRMGPVVSDIAGHLEATPVSRIVRSMILYECRRRGISPEVMSSDPERMRETTGLFSSSPVPVLWGSLSLIGDTTGQLNIFISNEPTGLIHYSGKYELEMDPSLWKPEETIREEDTSEKNSPTSGEHLPDGLLRLSLSCAPGGVDGQAAWPPRTLTDYFLLESLHGPLDGIDFAAETRPSMSGGPYRIDTAVLTTITLVRNPAAPTLPASFAAPFDTVVLTIDTDPNARQERFELGETDFYECSDAEFLKYTGSVSYLNRIVRNPSPELFALLFNLRKPPLGELPFRQAIEKAIDRHGTLEVLLNNRGVPASGFFPPPNEPATVSKSNRERRKRMTGSILERLKNYPRPMRLVILIPEEDPAFLTIAEKIQADIRPLMINIQIHRTSWAVYEERMRAGQFDMALAAWNPRTPYRTWLAGNFSSGASANVTGYHRGAFDALISEQGDVDAAHDLLNIDRPAIPLFWLFRYAVLGPRLTADAFKKDPSFYFQRLVPGR